MARYSLQDLIARAMSGQIGYRGLHRLDAAGIDPSGLASSGIDPSNVPDAHAALGIRREGNFLRALQRAQAAQAAGQQVGDRTLARLHAGVETAPGVRLQAQDPGDLEAQLGTLLAAYRKRRPGALGGGGIYDL
jgi:hypothetical protein